MTEFEFSKVPQEIVMDGEFDDTCRCRLAAQTMQAISDGRLKVLIRQMGGKPTISNSQITLESTSGNIKIFIGADDSRVALGRNTLWSFQFAPVEKFVYNDSRKYNVKRSPSIM